MGGGLTIVPSVFWSLLFHFLFEPHKNRSVIALPGVCALTIKRLKGCSPIRFIFQSWYSVLCSSKNWWSFTQDVTVFLIGKYWGERTFFLDDGFYQHLFTLGSRAAPPRRELQFLPILITLFRTATVHLKKFSDPVFPPGWC